MAFHRSFFGLFAGNSDTVKKVEWIFPFSIHFAYFARLLSCWTAPHCKRLCVCVCADCAPSPLHSTIAIRCLCVFSILSDCCLHNKLDEFQFFFPSFSSSLTSCLTDLINFLKGFHFFAVFFSRLACVMTLMRVAMTEKPWKSRMRLNLSWNKTAKPVWPDNERWIYTQKTAVTTHIVVAVVYYTSE